MLSACSGGTFIPFSRAMAIAAPTARFCGYFLPFSGPRLGPFFTSFLISLPMNSLAFLEYCLASDAVFHAPRAASPTTRCRCVSAASFAAVSVWMPLATSSGSKLWTWSQTSQKVPT